ncbi:bifunctional nuclease family protein [Opitutaceae bacterium]|nr:bifunctional nuclease family protein [bacterium]MDB4385692.1 bifunctional nuclease family protein [Opitutaceae bacterium]
MSSEAIEVSVRGVMPTANGCAVFLGNPDKTFVIYVDHSVGNAIQMTLDGVKKERPLTHDLIGQVFVGLGVKLDQVLINAVDEGTFFARILLRMENELGQKIIELDARPSDSMVLAIQHQRPIYAARAVFDQVEDMSEILERVLRQKEEESSDQNDGSS